MDSLALHIYHLDEGEEADRVIQLLKPFGIGDKWPVERPTEQTNAIFVPVEIRDIATEVWEIRQQKLNKSLALLRALDRKTVDAIRALDLSVAMRVHTTEFFLPLESEFVSECGRLGLEICIYNSKACEAGSMWTGRWFSRFTAH